MKEIKKDTQVNDTIKASSCSVHKYYALATRRSAGHIDAFMLSKVDGKWCWLSPAGERNFCVGDSDFDSIMQKGLEDEKKNAILFFEGKGELYEFLRNPTKYEHILSI